MTTRPIELSEAFRKFKLPSNLERAIVSAGYLEPRPIQSRTIPAVLRGQDVMGLAQTGTGKTAAFALPILGRLGEEPAPGPRALVLAPTRELAKQIHGEFESFARFSRLTATTIYGGVPQASQVRALRKKPDILVACPGRLLDLLDQGEVKLRHVEVLVLDEADHMFDMGFLPAIRRVLRALPARRQNLLFSATMPREIRGLADEVLHKPCVVELAHAKPADTIEHGIYHVAQTDKFSLLRHLLGKPGFTSAIVFNRTKYRARRLAQQLGKSGLRAIALQGNMSQGQRDRAMQGFRSGRYNVLVATDIAARGIDVANVSHVINFDIPNTPDAYTHRIGRTGRSETSGKAFTFVTADDLDQVKAIELRLGSKLERLRSEDFERDAPRDPREGRGASARGAQRSVRQRSKGTGTDRSGGSGRGAEHNGRSSSPQVGAAKKKGTQLRNRAVGAGVPFGQGLEEKSPPRDTEQGAPWERKYKSTGRGGSRRGGRRRGMRGPASR